MLTLENLIFHLDRCLYFLIWITEIREEGRSRIWGGGGEQYFVVEDDTAVG